MISNSYPYGHPFWLGKPTREELFEEWPLGLLDAFQGGHCFVNGFGGDERSCNPDSYGTVLKYERVGAVMDLLTAEFGITPEEWTRFADFWIDHTNRQPITMLLGYEIRRRAAAPR